MSLQIKIKIITKRIRNFKEAAKMSTVMSHNQFALTIYKEGVLLEINLLSFDKFTSENCLTNHKI